MIRVSMRRLAIIQKLYFMLCIRRHKNKVTHTNWLMTRITREFNSLHSVP